MSIIVHLEVDVNIIAAAIHRVIHLLHPPVSASSCDCESVRSFPLDRLSPVDVTDLSDDASGDAYLKRTYYRHDSVYLEIVVILL